MAAIWDIEKRIQLLFRRWDCDKRQKWDACP